MAKSKMDLDEPRIEDFVRPRIKTWKQRIVRRSIKLMIDEDIIEALSPNPAKGLREWIESAFWKKIK